jgi:hypothetical protein
MTYMTGQRLSAEEARKLNELLDDIKRFSEIQPISRCPHYWNLRCVFYEEHDGPHRFDVGVIPPELHARNRDRMDSQ